MVTNYYLWNIHILNPPQKKIEVDGSDDLPLEEMGDFEVPALNFQGCRNGCVLQKTNVNNGRFFLFPIMEIHRYSLPSMKKHVEIATHVLKKNDATGFFNHKKNTTLFLHLVLFTKPWRNRQLVPTLSTLVDQGWSCPVAPIPCCAYGESALWPLHHWVLRVRLGGWSLVRWIGDG